MIKFFRKIRFELMSNNQTGRYFKYAIGEILLVVVGILIALQINNWNQERQKRSKEQLYLISFQNDLTNNSIELQRVIDKTDIIKKRADSVLLLKQGILEYLSDNSFTRCVMGGNGFTIYQAQGGTVKSLIASGDLNVISNDSLRLALATWEDNLLGVKECEMLLKTSSQEYKNYLDQHLDLIAVDEQGPSHKCKY